MSEVFVSQVQIWAAIKKHPLHPMCLLFTLQEGAVHIESSYQTYKAHSLFHRLTFSWLAARPGPKLLRSEGSKNQTRHQCQAGLGPSDPCMTFDGASSAPANDPKMDIHAERGGAMGGERAEEGEGEEPVYQELWFIVVMAAIALLLMGIVLAVALHKALNKTPLTRERPPLVATTMKKRNPMAVYPASNSMLFDTVPETAGVASTVTLKAFTMKMEEVLESKCEGGINQDQGGTTSLRRSISQVMDRKSVPADKAWEPTVSGHDSGMFMDDEEFVDTIKGFSTIRKEHTMFTDTNL
ncbi:usherin [Nerophis ophidion]|uniref:usherin n=1 Tax=Nerophis ophidion TaxID=159077 RepID=UPI002ADF82A1|nr:usherin [Nerophis ophidion]